MTIFKKTNKLQTVRVGCRRSINKYAWLPTFVHDSNKNSILIWFETYNTIQEVQETGTIMYGTEVSWVTVSKNKI